LGLDHAAKELTVCEPSDAHEVAKASVDHFLGLGDLVSVVERDAPGFYGRVVGSTVQPAFDLVASSANPIATLFLGGVVAAVAHVAFWVTAGLAAFAIVAATSGVQAALPRAKYLTAVVRGELSFALWANLLLAWSVGFHGLFSLGKRRSLQAGHPHQTLALQLPFLGETAHSAC
jgi:hypothetical protein